ncbi:MAG: hypothetical protein H0U16_03635 [Actinobacteria bacterium]|nr:hypothetical protein [Actinomycetota bacterium]
MVFAYLDPAAGGMIIQSIIALAVALPFILRSQIARGLDRIRGRNAVAKSEEHESSTD